MILDLHKWRGLFRWPSEPDLFYGRVTLGFVTVWVCRFCVTDRLNAMARIVGRDDDFTHR